jgi:hypothetical protein
VTIQIRKTYRGANPEMVRDEVQDLAQKQGIIVSDAKLQTYPLLSGATQSRVTLVFKTQGERSEDQNECGTAHIIGSPVGETKILLDMDENLLSQEKISVLQENLDFILGSYEIKW